MKIEAELTSCKGNFLGDNINIFDFSNIRCVHILKHFNPAELNLNLLLAIIECDTAFSYTMEF